jgi:FtsX-like permease family
LIAVFAWGRASVSRQWRAWLSLVFVGGFAGGAVLVCFAGAQRTDSAYHRFARAHLAADVIVFPPSNVDSGFDFGPLTRLPEVVASAPVSGFNTDTGIAVILADGYGQVVNVPKLLSGRLPRPDEPDAAAVTYTFARSTHVHVGEHLRVNFLGQRPVTGGLQPLVPITLRIVGIEVVPGEFPPIVQDRSFVGQFLVSPGFVSANVARLGLGPRSVELRLRRGDADVPAFNEALRRLTATRLNAPPLLTGQASAQAANVQRGIHLQAQALLLLGAFVALATALVVSQLLSRQSDLASDDHGTLRALGMTRNQLWLCGMGIAAAVGLGAAVVALATAVAASPLLPVGTARLAEPHTGLHVDALVLGFGALIIVALLPALAARPWWRVASRVADVKSEPSPRPPLSARAAAAVGLPPTATVGVAMALQPGRGRAAVPVRSSLGGMTMAVAALAAAVTFGASLTHLLATPRLYGWTWDVHIVDNSTTRGRGIGPVTQALQSDPRVEAVALVNSPPLTVNNSSVFSVSLDDLKGHISPVVVSGRAPQSADEVALGAKTMRDIHSHVGGTVDLSITVVRLLNVSKRVVGTVILPPESDAARLGVGVVMTGAGLQSLIPPEVHPPPQSEAIFRLAPGANRAAVLADLHRIGGPELGIYTPQAPSDLVNFGHVQNLPLILAGLLAALALATLAHTLVSSVRRRARDLAVLRTLGFLPRQVRRAVAWQSTTFVSFALVVGLPVGIAAGRLLWDTFATELGTRPEPVTPRLPIVLIVSAAVLLANLVAGIPALLASHTPPALALRTE